MAPSDMRNRLAFIVATLPAVMFAVAAGLLHAVEHRNERIAFMAEFSVVLRAGLSDHLFVKI